MKIIGKHKDYFDYLIHQYGVDEKLVLDRRGIGEWKSSSDNDRVGGYRGILVNRSSITKEPIPESYRSIIGENSYYLKYESINRWLIVNGRGYLLIKIGAYPNVYEFADNTNSIESRSWGKAPYVSGTLLQEFIDLSKIVKRHTFIIQSNRRNDQWEVYGDVPVLSEIKFSSIVDPQTIYLDTVNFISEHFADKEEEIVAQSSIEKLISHGFDKKTSFRHKKNV